MKKILLILLAILTFIGCGTVQVETEVQTETEINTEIRADVDLATLPDVIDVRTAATIQDLEDVVLIDVREQWEYDEAHIPGITLIPMSEFESRLDELPTDKTVVLACQVGGRSARIHAYLMQLGYENVHNMAGGIVAWEAAGLPVE